jgi:hypothetical protein
MGANNNQSRSKITRRTALASVGLVGSIGIAGCLGSIGESIGTEQNEVTVINNNSTNTVSVKILSKNGSTLYKHNYELQPLEQDESGSYQGNASKIIVQFNGGKRVATKFKTAAASCKQEQITVSTLPNGSVDLDTECYDK